jgi:hypothetical protein
MKAILYQMGHHYRNDITGALTSPYSVASRRICPTHSAGNRLDRPRAESPPGVKLAVQPLASVEAGDAKASAAAISRIGLVQLFQIGQAILGELPGILSGRRQGLDIPAYLFARGFEKFGIQLGRVNLQNMVDNLGHDKHPALQ